MPVRKPRLQVTLLSLLLLWSVIAQFAISGFLIVSHIRNRQNGVLPFQVQEDSLMLKGDADELRAMGLEPGDELTALNGHPISGLRELERQRFTWRPGQIVRATVRRRDSSAQMKTMERMVAIHIPHGTGLSWTVTIVLYTIVPVFSLVLGFAVAFSKPRDKLAWLTLAMMASFSQLGPANFFALPDPWMEVVVTYRSLMSNTWPLWVMLFGLYFPKPFRFLQGRRWVAVLVAVPFLALLGLDLYTDFYDASRISAIRGLAHVEHRFETTIYVIFLLCTASFWVSLTIKYWKSREADSRRRLQWLLTGTALGLFPVMILQLLDTFFNVDIPLWYLSTAIVAITLFPLTLAYVIIVQRAMEVRVAVRQGVRHAFARGGITAILIALSGVVVIVVIELVRSSSGLLGPIVLVATSGGFLVLIGKAGSKLAAWTDRHFFREAYDTEVILTELSQEVASIRDTGELLETVTRQISSSLHVPRVAVLLRGSKAFRPAYSCGFEATPAVELAPEAKAVRVLEQEKKPTSVYFEDENSWVQDVADGERRALEDLDTQLLLPITLKQRLLGIMSLGPKLSEAPYSTTDIRLLSAVASQTGWALENARLTESIRRQVAERERINRELEIARDVQQRLFPQVLPVIPKLDIAGYCRPQQDVGGDYYDFIRLQDSNLGIAVGDVSGKGIAAALMMATLQASLRSQTMRPSGGPAEMLSLMNRLVYDASTSNRYATFFYGAYRAADRRLIYVNAGHNAPMVCRKTANGREILRLTRGGTVLGLFPEVSYEEACVELHTEDIVVGFTDGISEAMDTRDEEWDEDRLIKAVCEADEGSAQEIIEHVLMRVDAFTKGAKQHDDMTLVVMRVE